MRRLAVFLQLCLLVLPLQSQGAGQTLVKGLRVWNAPDNTRLVFDTSGPVEHTIFSLHDPDRLVIDIPDASFKSAIPEAGSAASYIERIRHAPRNGKDLRVVIDLGEKVRTKSFMLPPNQYYGYRLVVDVEPRGERSATAPSPAAPTAATETPTAAAEAPAPAVAAQAQPASIRPAAPAKEDASPGREVVVAIDAGHGGEDPGALGPRGTREKDVVLDIARRLARLVEAEPGMRPVMIRTGDYYIALRNRVKAARKAGADLFVSIHADAFQDSRVQGSSVYTVSQRGASSEAARWLAEKENSADLIGGIELETKDDLLASVLLDLSVSGTMHSSRQAADQVLTHLNRVGKVHRDEVQYAGFAVLKSPDIPSMLVETAFISNPGEEAKLRDAAHQDRLARAMLAGIRDYFRVAAPPDTWIARSSPRRHVIARGDTLSGIAQQYRVNLRELRTVNELNDDSIRVGQVLTIPGGGS